MANAWEARGEGSVVEALWDTVRESMSEPERFFEEMPATGGLNKPLVYGTVMATVGFVLGQVWNIGWNALAAGVGAGFSSGEAAFAGLFSVGFGLVMILMSPLLAGIGLFIGAGFAHLGLLIVGGAKRDFEATFRVIAYSQGPNLLAVVPIIGSLVGGIWALVLEIIGIAKVHGIGKGRAAAGILLFPCCCALVSVILIMMLAGAAAVAAIGGRAR